MTSDNIKRRLQRAEKISGGSPFALLTDEQLDARIKELSIKGGLPPLDEAIKIAVALDRDMVLLEHGVHCSTTA